MTFHTVALKKKVFIMLPDAKLEFIKYHPEWDVDMISNNKIIQEVLKFYINSGGRA